MTFFGLIAEFFKETWSLIKTIGFEGGESDLLQKLEVKKGFLNSIKYFIYLLILPVKIAKYLVNPDFKLYRLIEKAVTPFLFLDFAFSENVVANTYESFVEGLKTGANSELKANISEVDKFKTMFIVRKLAVALIFSYVVLIGGEVSFAVMVNFIQNASFGGIFAGGFSVFAGMGSFSTGGASIGLLSYFGVFLTMLSTILFFGSIAVASILISYILYLGLKIIVLSLRDAYVLDKNEMELFLTDLIDFTHQKTKELYGETIAKQALLATYQNFVIDKNVDMLKDEKMVAKLDLKKELELLEAKNDEF